ncbi:MAG: hypothetical protein KGJ57_22140 [Sphingomonadales bacterium]|nr:hypothetical protein [Sphingomonadales bacterium]MDE2172090.1 hypothetical protein [Sphingomonadales bacterium]
MTSKLLLRIASFISLVFAAGHTLGGFTDWSPMGANAVLDSMRKVHFQTMGVSRSYLDFFIGFGWSLSIGMLLQATLLWFIATLAERDPELARPMIAAFALNCAASVAITSLWLFPVPALFAILLLVPLVLAWFATGRTPA